MSGRDWHTNEQKMYNWQSNKGDLRLHHDRLTCSWPSRAISKFVGINSGLKTTTTARPPWYSYDRHPNDLWCFVTDRRPTYDLGETASSYLCDSAKLCMTKKFQEWLVTDLRPCRITYEAIEWITTNLKRFASKGGSSCELGHSQVKSTNSTTVYDG